MLRRIQNWVQRQQVSIIFICIHQIRYTLREFKFDPNHSVKEDTKKLEMEKDRLKVNENEQLVFFVFPET